MILVAGGAGYIGTHTVVELINAGKDVVIVDNFYNSCEEAIARVEAIVGKKVKFENADIADEEAMRKICKKYKFSSIIQFSGYKAVGESVEKPLEYYTNNLMTTIVLGKMMLEFKIKNIVFSSSATVYGDPEKLPITEDFPLITCNPYGSTKLFNEYILKDLQIAHPEISVSLLRYFNPMGAHESGLIGEDPNDIPNNLVPYITQVAVGKRPILNVFGGDYDTRDGTCIRDFIHVVDLARGHVLALDKLDKTGGCDIYNLGTGKGYTVLEIIKGFDRAVGRKIPYKIVERRPGDAKAIYASTELAKKELGFVAGMGLDKMCQDSWNWQSKNPNGYRG